MKAFGRRLEVDPGVVGEREADIASAVEWDDVPQFRNERTEPVRAACLVPERVAEFAAS